MDYWFKALYFIYLLYYFLSIKKIKKLLNQEFVVSYAITREPNYKLYDKKPNKRFLQEKKKIVVIFTVKTLDANGFSCNNIFTIFL